MNILVKGIAPSEEVKKERSQSEWFTTEDEDKSKRVFGGRN